MELFFYRRTGIREDYTKEYDESVYGPPLKKGENDDVAVCRAENKEEAIIKFGVYFEICTEKEVSSIDELWWIENNTISILTPY